MKKLFVILLISSNLHAGNETGHGGDTYSYEFIKLGTYIAKELNKNKAAWSSLVNADDFSEAVKSTQIMSNEIVICPRVRQTKNGPITSNDIVDACNYPNKYEIHFSRKNWREALLKQKLLLVLHEYLGIIGTERDNYNVSLQMTALLEEVHTLLLQNKKNLNWVQYYGRCLSTTPLSQFGEICDERTTFVQNALSCAEQLAIVKCESEQKSDCEVKERSLLSFVSSSALGYRYCEVTVIAKRVDQ